MKPIIIELERFEATLAEMQGRTVMVKVPLVGTAFLAFYGRLQCQTDESLDTQFVLYRDGAPTLVFYIKDVALITPYQAPANPIIDLKKSVDQKQVVE